uniref:Dual specificity phosphatase n=1 Tax=Marseillevirus LCMAC103 TaxID=2506604 RepID=A0A481YVW3_9VIRU|nr:MAG: dual specificity phosphatase [Marseillevirus LCMAC103]
MQHTAVASATLAFGRYPHPPREAVKELEAHGYNIFVDLTTAGERATGYRKHLGASSRHFAHPIADRRVPRDVERFREFVRTVLRAASGRDKIYVHCRGGHGRAGLAAAVFLVEGPAQARPEEALQIVRTAHQRRPLMKDRWRKMGAPQTQSQKDFVLGVAKAPPTQKGNDRFVFYSKSSNVKPGAYKGVHWSENVSDAAAYAELAKIHDWRKKLSNFHVAPFVLDEEKWSSVEHFFHAAKYRGRFPRYYATFAADGGKPWSTDPKASKQAGKAGRVSKAGRVFRATIGGAPVPTDVKMRNDFYSAGLDRAAMKLALLAKFAQNSDLKVLLLATGTADLYHLVTQRGQKSHLQFWDHLMTIRHCIRKYDSRLDIARVSAMSTKQVDQFLA